MRWLGYFFHILRVGLIAFIVLRIYQIFFGIPETPELSLTKWWGPKKAVEGVDESIRPFTINFTEEMKKDLRTRLNHTQFHTEPLEVTGFQYGFNNDYLEEVIIFWKTRYNFESRQGYLNAYPQFKTNIQGLDIHFVHVKPDETKNLKVIPLLLLHGWPGSFLEFFKMVPYLTTPRPGKTFIFELIIPSLPGFAYSQGSSKIGFGEFQMAGVMKNLMERLGHQKYIVQGGGLGSNVGSIMATLYPDNLIGYHSNYAVTHTPLGTLYTLLGSLIPRLVVSKENEHKMYPLKNQLMFLLSESGFLHIQATKPETIGAALSDSPSGLAAYILEKFSTWTNRDNMKRADGGLLQKFILTELLDNVMVYWDSKCIMTSMRPFAESFYSENMNNIQMIPTNIPTAIARFDNDIIFQSRLIHKTKYKNIVQLSDIKGGHFAAMEQPDILAEDIWSATMKFKDLNQEYSKTEL